MKMNEQMEELCKAMDVDFEQLQALFKSGAVVGVTGFIPPEVCSVIAAALEIAGE
jgi:hypothetical protein